MIDTKTYLVCELGYNSHIYSGSSLFCSTINNIQVGAKL